MYALQDGVEDRDDVRHEERQYGREDDDDDDINDDGGNNNGCFKIACDTQDAGDFCSFAPPCMDFLFPQQTDPRVLLECNYDTNCSALYKRIESGDYDAVYTYLTTGFWPNKLFADAVVPVDAARTWVYRVEHNTNNSVTSSVESYAYNDVKIRWRQLPIHLALLGGAPIEIIKLLLRLYPDGIRYTDDQSMLPLHLALRYNCNDETVEYLIAKFPQAIRVKTRHGYTPLDCAKRGKNPSRGIIIQAFLREYHLLFAPGTNEESGKTLSPTNYLSGPSATSKHISRLQSEFAKSPPRLRALASPSSTTMLASPRVKKSGSSIANASLRSVASEKAKSPSMSGSHKSKPFLFTYNNDAPGSSNQVDNNCENVDFVIKDDAVRDDAGVILGNNTNTEVCDNSNKAGGETDNIITVPLLTKSDQSGEDAEVEKETVIDSKKDPEARMVVKGVREHQEDGNNVVTVTVGRPLP